MDVLLDVFLTRRGLCLAVVFQCCEAPSSVTLSDFARP